MEQNRNSENESVIGIDLGDRYSHLCVLDGDSRDVLEESRIPTTSKGFDRRFATLARARVAIEAGTHSGWIRDQLETLGHEVIVANPRKVRSIFENDSKNDRADAEQLARLAAADVRLLHPIQHRTPKTRADRAVLIARDQAVATRTALINCTRGLVKANGERLKSGGSAAFHRKVREQIPESLKAALFPLLDLLDAVEKTIKDFGRTITRLSEEEYPETAILKQVHGVGPITALGYVLTIEDPTRFKSSRSVGAFFGLRPKSKDSGMRSPELPISKAGDRMLRRNLVQCAQYILGRFGQDCDLRRWGLKLASRGCKNAKKRAVVAVARRLAVLLHRLWLGGLVYEPLRNAQAGNAA